MYLLLKRIYFWNKNYFPGPIMCHNLQLLNSCFGGRVAEGYGMTETTCVISCMDEGDNLSGHVGSPNAACGEWLMWDLGSWIPLGRLLDINLWKEFIVTNFIIQKFNFNYFYFFSLLTLELQNSTISGLFSPLSFLDV